MHWTSFDVVNKLRHKLKHLTGKKKNKVGHAGTLDPLATGLVVICLGYHTKSIEGLMGLDKEYTGSFKLGETTPSFDLETEVDTSHVIPPLDHAKIESVRQSFLGEQMQTPPIFSAKKIEGKKAYDLARKGKPVEMKPNWINIQSIEVTTERYPHIDFQVHCSKGTYIRSLAHDFGKKLGCGAHLTKLRRTKIGELNIDDAFQIDDAVKHVEHEYLKYLKLNSV